MTRDDAKKILHLYEPELARENAADFQEALHVASEDPVLRDWLRRELATDQAISSRLSEAPIPPNLRAKILANPPRRALSWMPFLAMAAVLVLVVSIGAVVIRSPSRPALASWQTNALSTLSEIVSGRKPLDRQEPDSAALVKWLASNGNPTPDGLPPGLAGKEALGCKALLVDGRRVSIICFHVTPTEAAHLVTTDTGGLQSPPPEKAPLFVKSGEWETASWSADGHSYMLAMQGSEQALRALLPQKA